MPFLQKTIIDKARVNGKAGHRRDPDARVDDQQRAPTRAEVSDVANAILDGADAVMLSGETGWASTRSHTVETMARIIQATEVHAMEQQEVGTLRALPWDPHTKSGVIAKAAGEVAERVDAKYVVAFTQSGDSARRMSRLRGPVPVLAFTPEAQTRSQLALTWGVETFKTASVEHTDEMVAQVDEQLLNIGRVEKGDLVVIVAGSAARHPRLDQRPARAPHGRRGRRRRAGVPEG